MTAAWYRYIVGGESYPNHVAAEAALPRCPTCGGAPNVEWINVSTGATRQDFIPGALSCQTCGPRGASSTAEPLPSKQAIGVQLPGAAPRRLGIDHVQRMVAAEIAGAVLTDADLSEMFKLRAYFRAIARGEFRAP